MSTQILVVDDEPHILRVTELSLKKGGYQILTARNGRQALEIAARERPALIVMDVLMPEMDGLTALKHLKESPATAGIPVIMLTGRGQNMAGEEAGAAGAELYLTKPCSPTHLLDQARQLIERHQGPNPSAT